eukprot:101737_1
MTIYFANIFTILFQTLYCMHSQHDIWNIMPQFMDSNATKQFRLLSTYHDALIRIKIQNDWAKLTQWIDTLHTQAHIDQTLHRIHDLIHNENAFLKVQLQAYPSYISKLLFPQIKQGLIITNHLQLNTSKPIAYSNVFRHYFYHYLTSIKEPQNESNIQIYGSLFGLKLLDNEMNPLQRQLHGVRSSDIINLIQKSRNFNRALMFDSGVFEIFCNPIFYNIHMHGLGKVMSRMITRYLHFKGVPQWHNHTNISMHSYRRHNRCAWRDMMLYHIKKLWKSYRKYFENDYEYRDNLRHLSNLLSLIWNELGFRAQDALDPFMFMVFRRLCNFKDLSSSKECKYI